MGNACFSHCQKHTLSKSGTKEASSVSFAPSNQSNTSALSDPSINHNFYYDDNDSVKSDDLFFDSEAYVWFDAFENFPSSDQADSQQQQQQQQGSSETNFSLSNPALKMIRTRLKDSFPNDRNFLNDDYIRAMAVQVYINDRNPRRAIESTIETLSKIMKWRDAQNLSELPHLVSMAAATKAQRQRWRVSISQLQKAHPLVASLNTASMYWHGLTREGRPILWVHPTSRISDNDQDTKAQMMACQLLADVGIQYGMPSGISNVCVILVHDSHESSATSSSINIGNLTRSKFIKTLIQVLTEGYPHRIDQIWIPTFALDVASSAVAVIMDKYNSDSGSAAIIQQLADSFVVCEMEECRERLAEQVLWNGWEDLPTFLGGQNTDHGRYYSYEAKKKKYDDDDDDVVPAVGESLTFDFYGMKDRMMEQRTEHEEQMGT